MWKTKELVVDVLENEIVPKWKISEIKESAKPEILWTLKENKKDYNSRMAINVPENENVQMVNMGQCKIMDNSSRDHLLTYGLWTCVGVAIVIKNKNWNITSLLAHLDMWWLIGLSIEQFAKELKKMKNKISEEINSIEISLTSTQSYKNLNYLNQNEKKLINTILTEFQENGITEKDIKHHISSQVQISPDGIISIYSDREIKQHKEKMLGESIHDFGWYIEPNLNIYITKYGARMTNCGSLKLDSTEQEKEQYLKERYYQDYIEKWYKLTIGPSFNNPDRMAVYVKNGEDPTIQQRGTVPGCVSAKQTFLRI